MDVEPGIYQHFRTRKQYKVVGVGLHTETNEQMVIYMPLYVCEQTFFIRPLAMFAETVEHEGQQVPRFSRVVL